MREIKFRGTVSDDCEFDGDILFTKGQLAYGHLVTDDKGQPYIMGSLIEVDNEYTIFESWIAVDENSVGQWTGLKDKTGKEIYEGDVILTAFAKDKQVVRYAASAGSFYLWADGGATIPLVKSQPLEIFVMER